MPVFTLTKYDEPIKPTVAQADSETQDKSEEQQEIEQQVTIHANDTVSKIVADALYKTLSKTEKVEQANDKNQVDTEVVSTEDINHSPADVWLAVKKAKNVVIVNEGFKTAKEEWFLSTLEAQGKTVFYSMESYLASLNLKKAGV